MSKNNDTTDIGARQFVEANIAPYLSAMQAGFDGVSGWIELDQISIVRLSTGAFKCSLKGHKRGDLGLFRPSVLYLEADTLPGVFAAIAGEMSDPDQRWFSDRYPKPRQARAKKLVYGDFSETGIEDVTQ